MTLSFLGGRHWNWTGQLPFFLILSLVMMTSSSHTLKPCIIGWSRFLLEARQCVRAWWPSSSPWIISGFFTSGRPLLGRRIPRQVYIHKSVTIPLPRPLKHSHRELPNLQATATPRPLSSAHPSRPRPPIPPSPPESPHARDVSLALRHPRHHQPSGTPRGIFPNNLPPDSIHFRHYFPSSAGPALEAGSLVDAAFLLVLRA